MRCKVILLPLWRTTTVRRIVNLAFKDDFRKTELTHPFYVTEPPKLLVLDLSEDCWLDDYVVTRIIKVSKSRVLSRRDKSWLCHMGIRVLKLKLVRVSYPLFIDDYAAKVGELFKPLNVLSFKLQVLPNFILWLLWAAYSLCFRCIYNHSKRACHFKDFIRNDS